MIQYNKREIILLILEKSTKTSQNIIIMTSCSYIPTITPTKINNSLPDYVIALIVLGIFSFIIVSCILFTIKYLVIIIYHICKKCYKNSRNKYTSPVIIEPTNYNIVPTDNSLNV
jgi:hypothetical protein